jgi:hypothetical protein
VLTYRNQVKAKHQTHFRYFVICNSNIPASVICNGNIQVFSLWCHEWLAQHNGCYTTSKITPFMISDGLRHGFNFKCLLKLAYGLLSQNQGWQGRRGAGGAGRKKSAPQTGARGAAKRQAITIQSNVSIYLDSIQ